MKKLGLVILSTGAWIGWNWWLPPIIGTAASTESQAVIRFYGQLPAKDNDLLAELPPAKQLTVVRDRTQMRLSQTNEHQSANAVIAGTTLLTLLVTLIIKKRGTKS